MTKKCAERIHAKKRFKQRFGKELNRRDLIEVVHSIHNNKCKFIKKESNRVSLYLANVKGHDTIVAYDRNRHNVITFMEAK